MGRIFKALAVAMLIVSVTAGSTWAAATIQVNGGTIKSAALEAMGAARSTTLAGVNGTNALRITSSRSLIAGDLVNFSFSGIGLQAATLYLCANSSNSTTIDSVSVSSNATSVAFRSSTNIAADVPMWVANDANACAQNIAGGNLPIRLLPRTGTGLATASFNVTTSSGTLLDSGATTNAVNFINQYGTAYSNSVTSTIDYLSAPANGSKFATNNAYTEKGSTANTTNTAVDYKTVDNAGLTVSGLISLQDSAGWSGVKSVYIKDGATELCSNTGAANTAASNSPSGTVNLSIGTVFNGTGALAASNSTVCAEVTGSTTLQARTITGAIDINVTGDGANDPAMDSYRTLMSWLPNGYQGIVPYMTANSSYTVICFINNKSSASGPVTVDVLTSESNTTSLSGQSLGTLAAAGTMRVDFDGNVTPYSWSDGKEIAGTPIATGLPANDRYTVMINVGASPSQVNVTCIQADPNGPKRSIPVLTQIGSSNPWQQ